MTAVTITKPCECGCGVVLSSPPIRRDHLRGQRFAGRACVMRWRNVNDPDVIAGRAKGAKATTDQAKAARAALVTSAQVKAAKAAKRVSGREAGHDPGGLTSPLSWLDQPSARQRARMRAEGIVT